MAQTATWTTFRVPESLPNDTEESLVGTEWHQEAIGALAAMLRDVADRRSVSWGVCEQIALLGLRYLNGLPYDPRPDVMVLAQPVPGIAASIPLAEAGVPLFIAEVASDSTARHDRGDKMRVYEAIGVREYLVFDTVGTILHTPLLAWRLEAGAYVPWEPDVDGWWHSMSLDVSFRATQPFLGVRDRDGTIIEPSRVVRRRARQLEYQLAEMEERLAAAERAQAEAEQARADEARRRAALEEQLRRLQDERDAGGAHSH